MVMCKCKYTSLTGELTYRPLYKCFIISSNEYLKITHCQFDVLAMQVEGLWDWRMNVGSNLKIIGSHEFPDELSNVSHLPTNIHYRNSKFKESTNDSNNRDILMSLQMLGD